MVGRGERQMAEVAIRRHNMGMTLKGGRMVSNMHPPYLPEKLTDEFHPGGNSVCYGIQLAHLMGCNPIYLLGFTLRSGSNYFYGRQNPVTGRSTLYQAERALHWLRWYESQHPGRVRLFPGWDGPIYDVFQVEDYDEDQAEGEAHQAPRHDQPVSSHADEDQEAGQQP